MTFWQMRSTEEGKGEQDENFLSTKRMWKTENKNIHSVIFVGVLMTMEYVGTGWTESNFPEE